MGFLSYCQWGLELLRPSDRETLLRTGPMAQLDPRMHKTDQLDTLDTHLPTKIDSSDLSQVTSGEITQPVSQMLVHCCKFHSLWIKANSASFIVKKHISFTHGGQTPSRAIGAFGTGQRKMVSRTNVASWAEQRAGTWRLAVEPRRTDLALCLP